MAQWGDYDRYESLQEIGVGAYGTVYRFLNFVKLFY